MDRINKLYEIVTDERLKDYCAMIQNEGSFEKKFELAIEALALLPPGPSEERQLLVSFISDTQERWIQLLLLIFQPLGACWEQLKKMYGQLTASDQRAAIERIIIQISMRKRYELAKKALPLFEDQQEERMVLQEVIAKTRDRILDVENACARHVI